MKIFITLVISIFSLSLFAQNNITIFSEDGHPFYLILNGIRQNENPETNVRVNGLNAEYYTAKVIFSNESLGVIEKKTLMAAGIDCQPCDVTYKIKADKKGELTLKAFGFTPLAQAPPPPANVRVVNYNTVPMPAPVFGVQVTETTTTRVNGTSDNVNMGVNVGGFNMDVNVNVNDGFGSSTHTTTTTTTTVIPSQTVVVEQGCPPMSPASFNALISSMGNKSFDDDKLLVAKQAASSNCMTTSQIRTVMNALEWDEARLDFAKHAYTNCVDPQNYFQVNDAFEWDDASEELNNFIH